MRQSGLQFNKLSNNQEPPIDEILRYKALGDKWSEIASLQLELKILDDKGGITVSRLLSVHKSIFPECFPWAGRYRKEHVYVVDNFGTTARIIDVVQAESRNETIPPEKIEANLAALMNHWNEGVEALVDRELDIKLDEVANFHHEFQLVHPFLDGNGRIGRMLLEEQLPMLFQQKVTFRPDRDDLYCALRMMNMGKNTEFMRITKSELERFNVAL